MWSKLDDQFFLNPKNARMDRDEQDLHLAAIVYCNGQLTDGFIPAGILLMLCNWAKIPLEANPQAIAQAIASRLVEHGFWEIAEGGYQIHDFLDWNPSREEVLAMRSARSEAGRRGGMKSAAKRSKCSSKNEANAQAKMKQNSTPSPSPSPSLKREEEGAAAASFSDDPQLESIFQQVTGMITIPGTARENSLGTLRTIRSMKGSDLETVEYLRGFFLAWKNRNYNLSNLGWLNDWAVSGEIPAHKKPEPPAVRTRKLTDARGNVIEVPA